MILIVRTALKNETTISLKNTDVARRYIVSEICRVSIKHIPLSFGTHPNHILVVFDYWAIVLNRLYFFN